MTAPKLSPREHQLLTELSAGASEKGAARKMGIEHNTVKSYARNIREKLGEDKMIAAVSKAFRLGVLQ